MVHVGCAQLKNRSKRDLPGTLSESCCLHHAGRAAARQPATSTSWMRSRLQVLHAEDRPSGGSPTLQRWQSPRATRAGSVPAARVGSAAAVPQALQGGGFRQPSLGGRRAAGVSRNFRSRGGKLLCPTPARCLEALHQTRRRVLPCFQCWRFLRHGGKQRILQ